MSIERGSKDNDLILPEDEELELAPLPSDLEELALEDLVLEEPGEKPEPKKQPNKIEQKQLKRENKAEAKEEYSFTMAGKTYKRGQAVKLVIKKDGGSEYAEDWKFSGVLTNSFTGKNIIVIENQEGAKMNYPMDMFEEGLSGRQLEMSLRFETEQEKRLSSAELLKLLKEKKARLNDVEKSKVAEWVKDTNRTSLQPQIEKLEAEIREVGVGKGDAVEFVKVEDRDFNEKREPTLKVEELTPEELAEIRDEFSRLPISISGPDINRAIVRFLNIKGSTKKDLVIILGPQEGRKISTDGKDVVGLSESTTEISDLGMARVIKFYPRENLKFGKREINEVRLFIGSEIPEELREDLGDTDLQKKTTDYADRIINKNKGKENFVSTPIINGLTGIDSPEAWKIREQSNHGTEFVRSLSGINSKRAWGYREEALDGRRYYEVANSLVGLDSDRAWRMREDVMKLQKEVQTGIDTSSLSKSLAGLDSDKAWQWRARLVKERETSVSDKKMAVQCLIPSLTGLDSERAWQMREAILKTMEDRDFVAESVAQGLAGLDSDRAWKIRDQLLALTKKKPGSTESLEQHLIQGLVGVNSDRAWKMREEFLKQKKFLAEIARSLAGIDSDVAENMRGRLIMAGCHEEDVLQGIYGGTEMVAVRKARQNILKTKKK